MYATVIRGKLDNLRAGKYFYRADPWEIEPTELCSTSRNFVC
jgi:hypothetical protein